MSGPMAVKPGGRHSHHASNRRSKPLVDKSSTAKLFLTEQPLLVSMPARNAGENQVGRGVRLECHGIGIQLGRTV